MMMLDEEPVADLPTAKRAEILQEIAALTRRPTMRPYEISARMYADTFDLVYNQARTELETGWREGKLLKRKVHHESTWKWAYAQVEKVPEEQRREYEYPTSSGGGGV